jgi:Cbb3-type cytochrome oxidase, subunit 1
MNGKPFIDSVTAMAPYWLWRAIGGTLMWISHLVFAYNMYKMIKQRKTININEKAIENLETGEEKLVDITG